MTHADRAVAELDDSADVLPNQSAPPGRRWIVWDDESTPTLLIRENATPTYPLGRTRMTRTRLKTARISGSSRSPAVTVGGRR